jgi:signal transduction histidine kinase/ligand-binding sensor domain-containing protein/DNA-binding response OmpR family regulator
MWIGTDEALIRYDGSTAYRYLHNPQDRNTIPHNTVNTIIEGKDSALWIGTAQGLCVYNRELDNFSNVDSIRGNKNFLNNRYITDLEFDSQGQLWIGTHEGGINIYNPIKKEFAYLVDPPRGGVMPATNFIHVLLKVGDTVWCASKAGLLLFDTRTGKRLPLNSLRRFSNAPISTIVRENSQSLLIGTLSGEVTRVVSRNGHYSIQELLFGHELGESANRILAMSFDRAGNILLGGENSGFSYLNMRTNKLTRLQGDESNAKRLPTNSVQAIYADDLGLTWVGTSSHGAFLLDNNRKKFEVTEESSGELPFKSKDVRGFAQDKTGNIWIAFYGEGVGKIDHRTHALQRADEINKKIGNKNITSIVSSKRGELWFATDAKGVFSVNPATNEVNNYALTSEGFGNDQVYCLYEGKDGTIWAGTWGSGLFYHEKSSDRFVSVTEYDQPDHIPNTAYVSDIIEDAEGTLWVGTLYGLYELRKRTQNSFSYRLHLPASTRGSISGSQVQVIVEDHNHDLWVGTSEALNVKRKGASTFTAYQMDSGKPVNTIRSLVVDPRGNVWIGGNKGLSKFDRTMETFTTYTREDGLKSNNFNRKASLASSSGKFFYGSVNGFDSFFPDSISTTSASAQIVFSDLRINNQSVKPGGLDSPLEKHISLTSNLVLSYDQRSFAIDFVALDHAASTAYTYCYKLEGFDKDWICAGSNHSATYTNIDPGQYVFLVKAANRDGLSMEAPLKLDITIQQVFWKSWWAFCVYTAALMFLIYFLVRIRVERMRLKSEITFEKLTREHEHRLSESKTQFFTNVAHEFRTPLSLILIPLESLMEVNEVPARLRERIFTAYKNASRMRRLVNELLDFNKLESGNFRLHVRHGELVQFITESSSAFNEMAAQAGIRFSTSSETPTIPGWFDADKLERMIFNVLSNAFKFTAAGGEITLKITAKHSIIPDGTLTRCVELVIEDNGIGISPEELPRIFEKFYQAESAFRSSSPGTGIGLSLTKALVELHHGTITVTSVPNHSTIFTILLPIDPDVYKIDSDMSMAPEIVHAKMPDDVALGDVNDDTDRKVGNDTYKILVVEDNIDLRKYLAEELRARYTVFEATDGAEGLAIAMDKNPDLIISDIMMPVKDGLELCDAIKAELNTSHIPFILLTAKATMEDQIKGVRTGADLYISKPFNIQYLLAHVQQILTSRRKLYARFSQDVYLMPAKATTNALDQDFLQRVIDHIVNNLQDPQLSVDSIAELFNLSRMQFYRKIKALTGKSAVEFIRMVRMKQALKLMDSHKLTLSEIAFEVGFNSASYFTRAFKEEFGKTPSEYMEQD